MKFSNRHNKSYPDDTWAHYGGLSPVLQDQYIASEEAKSFHNPPARRGLFCFPRGYEEMFLIGSTCDPTHRSNKSFYLKDRLGEKLQFSEHFSYSVGDGRPSPTTPEMKALIRLRDIQLKRIICAENGCVAVLRRPRLFQYRGNFWHHLIEETPQRNRLAEKGSWVLSTFDTWKDAFRAVQHEDRKKLFKRGSEMKENRSGGNFLNVSLPYSPYKIKALGYIPMDHLEVFIERVK